MNKESKSVPKHIAVIMDGNGRWAKKRGLPRVMGHREGVKTVRRIVEVCGEIGVEVLTLYTFSTENWNRPKEEVSALMQLLLQTLQKELDDLIRKDVQLRVMGDMDRLPDHIRIQLEKAMDVTGKNQGLILNLALNYGAREEIVRAVKSLQLSDKKKIAVPANWPNNELIHDRVIIPPAKTVIDAKERSEKYDCYDWWFCHQSLDK